MARGGCLPSALKLLLPAISCRPLTRVRVSGGHLCEAEAPTEAAAEKLAKPQVLTEGERPQANVYSLTSNIRNAKKAERPDGRSA